MTAAGFAAIICMDKSVCQSIIKTRICCIPKTNAVDKGNSSSTQVNWSSGCYHLALCADLFVLNVILRMCTMGGVGSTQDLKTTNFHRLPCTRKAQSAQYFVMKSKFKVS